MKNKKIYLIFLIIIIIIIIASGLYLVFTNNNQKENRPQIAEKEAKKISEEELLLKDNSSVVEMAGQKLIQPVKQIDKNDNYWGDINSKIQLVVYCDYTDVFCANFNDVLEKLKTEYKDSLAIAYRHYLLSGSTSLSTAEISECAAEQGKFSEMNGELVALSKDNKIALFNKEEAAKKINLNLAKFDNCINTEKFKEKITVENTRAVAEGVMGAPTVFINGQILPGAYPFDDFTDSSGAQRTGLKTIIDSYLKKQ
jgi:protein-disulfide isomerase